MLLLFVVATILFVNHANAADSLNQNIAAQYGGCGRSIADQIEYLAQGHVEKLGE